MSPRRRSSSFWHNLKFMGLMTLVSGVVAMGIAIATQGLDGIVRRASIALKAMDNPAAMSKVEKEELKNMLTNVKDTSAAKKQLGNMSAEQKERAKQQFNQLDEGGKKRD